MTYIIRSSSNSSANISNPNYISCTATMTDSTWNTAASHETFTVTGVVRIRMWIECTGTLTDAADGASIQFGHAGSTTAFIGSTGAAGAGASTISAGELWYDTSPTTVLDTFANTVMDYVIIDNDIGYEITGAALTGGTLVFHAVWEALSPTGNVAVGAGGSLT